jgi:hypothetical protein
LTVLASRLGSALTETCHASPTGTPVGDGDTDGNGVIDVLDLGNLANDYGETYP